MVKLDHTHLGLFTTTFILLFDISMKTSVVSIQAAFKECFVSYVNVLDS